MIAAAVRRMRSHPRPWIWSGVTIVIGLLLGIVPLFGVLGYELALIMSFVAAVAGLDLGAAFARSLQTTPGEGLERATYAGRALARSTVAASAIAVVVTVLPALVCAVRGLWVPTCDWWFGIKAYLMMPITTAALAGALGHAIGCAVGVRSERRWYPHRGTWIAIALPLVVLAAAAAWRFYSEPPVFVYSPILGYFPGNMYDENLVLGAPLWWSRLEQIAAVIAIVAAVAWRLDVPRFRVTRAPRPAGRRTGALVIAAVAAAFAVVLQLDGGALGFAVDADDIQNVLDGRIETAHFIIHYARTPAIEADIKLLAEDHELRYAEVVADLGVAPAGKLGSYYFANGDQKARWMGARNVEMAKPWRHEIYLDHREFPHSSLRHEIAHAVASAFGDPILGIAVKDHVLVNPGLVEGLAVAIDWPGEGTLTPHESAHVLQVLGYLPPLEQLFSLGFLGQSSIRGYATAGSFVRFLFERYGAEKLRALYRSGDDFEGVYGKSFSQLEHEWKEMIAAIALPPDVIEAARERFRRTSVFSRPCPHAIAARRDAAADAAAEGDRQRAIRLMRNVCKDAPEEPSHRFELGIYLAGGTEGDRTEAIDLWTAIAADAEHVTSTLRANALDRLARAAATRGDLAAVKDLITRESQLSLDGGQRRLVIAQLYALDHDGPAGPALRGYFFAPPGTFDQAAWSELAIIGEPELGLGHYLLAFQHYHARSWQGAVAEYEKALARELPGIEFVENAARELAVAAYRAGDRDGVRTAIAALRRTGTSEVDRLLAKDWERRLAFDAQGHL
jgi:hypothetical protein